MARLVDGALRAFAASGCDDADGLWETLARHIDLVAEACRDNTQWVDEQRADAAMSSTILMPICLENGRDLVHGGAATHYAHWEGIGLPNAADMLYAADQLALRTGRPLDDVFAKLDAGDPEIYAQIDALPKFGNDAEGPDGMAAKLVTLLADALERRSTPLRQAMMLGHLAGGENMHICYGRLMGATLDGRMPGQPLADSMVGSQGKNTNGPTAVIRSLCRLDHSRLVAGNVSTVRLSPSDFATPEARRRVVARIRAFVALGGSQLQFNVIDGATLRKAQASPRDYRGLLVRVAGYSSHTHEIPPR
jgi:formate C-acetyltransferase